MSCHRKTFHGGLRKHSLLSRSFISVSQHSVTELTSQNLSHYETRFLLKPCKLVITWNQQTKRRFWQWPWVTECTGAQSVRSFQTFITSQMCVSFFPAGTTQRRLKYKTSLNVCGVLRCVIKVQPESGAVESQHINSCRRKLLCPAWGMCVCMCVSFPNHTLTVSVRNPVFPVKCLQCWSAYRNYKCVEDSDMFY